MSKQAKVNSFYHKNLTRGSIQRANTARRRLTSIRRQSKLDNEFIRTLPVSFLAHSELSINPLLQRVWQEGIGVSSKDISFLEMFFLRKKCACCKSAWVLYHSPRDDASENWVVVVSCLVVSTSDARDQAVQKERQRLSKKLYQDSVGLILQ